MKRTKENPSVIGLLLIVTGMLLFSMAALKLLERGAPAPGTGSILLGLFGAAVMSCLAGIFLSGRKRR